MQVKVPVLSAAGDEADSRIGRVKRVSDAMLSSFVYGKTIGVVDARKYFGGSRTYLSLLDLGTMEVPHADIPRRYVDRVKRDKNWITNHAEV